MNQVDLEVFGQSWEHYRHLENIRQKTATFYYTLIATIVTGMGFLLNLKDPGNSDLIVTVALGLTNVVTLYGVFAYFAVVKLQAARSAHGALIQTILMRAYGSHFEELYNTPFRGQLDKSTPTLLRKGIIRLILRRPPEHRRELLFSQTPIFIFLPMILISASLVFHVSLLDALTPSVHKIFRIAAAAINVSCTAYVCLAIMSPQDSWPEVDAPDLRN